MPLEWEHFEDHWSFDENWRKWIDDPPVGWRPPKGVPVFWRVVDLSSKDGWIIRLDAWMGAEGLHMHFRWVILLHLPDRESLDEWLDAGSPTDKIPPPAWTVTRKAVAGFVIPWSDLGWMEDDLLSPGKGGKNGKGADLTDADRREL